jgi:hypothetical protein
VKNLPKILARYRKAITAEVGAVLTWLSVSYVPDGHITRVEWYGLIVALAAGAGVFAVPNDPKIDNPVAAAIPPTTSGATVVWQAASQSQTEAS